MKYYGSPLCPDCQEATAILQERNVQTEFVNITASMKELKEFLALRDSREEFIEVKKNGWVGIPCFLREDGRITFDVNEVL